MCSNLCRPRSERERGVNGAGSRVVSVPADTPAPSASTSTFTQDGSIGLRLLPAQPPGRCTRKALPFAGEIGRLYAMGYTLEAIRQALFTAGVSVSRSTVHREVRRGAVPAPLPFAIQHAEAASEDSPAPLQSEPTHAIRARDPPRSTSTVERVGKEGAEAFFKSHESNPLFPTKEST
jgi:hypothetical protein